MSATIQNVPFSGTAACTYTAPKRGDLCQRCRQRPSAVAWGDPLAQAHGFYQWWCEVCALSEQLKHAREQAKRIPDLQRRLRNARRRKVR